MRPSIALASTLACFLTGFDGQTRSRPAEAPGALLRVDAGMFELSAATGGDFYFWSPGEFARAKLEVPLGGEDLLLAYGELAGEREHELCVDTLLGRLEIFVGAQELADVSVQRPDGSLLSPGALVRIQRFDHMRIATIESPASGRWRIRIAGRGLSCLTVRGGGTSALPAALAPILLVDFGFVELGGRPGHEGWFPLEREPQAGEELMARVDLAGSFASAELGFAGKDGRPLAGAWIPLSFEAGDDSTWVRCSVPREPFRVLVRGFDVSGAPWQRVHAPVLVSGAPSDAR